jgi:hypothetical protein
LFIYVVNMSLFLQVYNSFTNWVVLHFTNWQTFLAINYHRSLQQCSTLYNVFSSWSLKFGCDMAFLQGPHNYISYTVLSLWAPMTFVSHKYILKPHRHGWWSFILSSQCYVSYNWPNWHKFQVEVFWFVMACSVVVVTSPWRWRQHGPLKHWYPTTTLHSNTTQKTSTWILIGMKTSYVTCGPSSLREYKVESAEFLFVQLQVWTL